MSILNIKERFSQRIQESEKEAKEPVIQKNASEKLRRQFIPSSIREVDVGISQYVSDLPGFHAIIKQRYSDFNVHEIDNDGKMAILNSYELPDESIGSEALETTLIEESVIQELEKLLDESFSVDSVTIDVTNKSKDERKSIHQFMKAKYGTTIISNTSDDGEKKMITITRNCGEKETRRAGHLPKHLHFILCKSNLDTTNALGLIATKLKVKVANFNIAGTKDKRANTVQWVSIKNMYARQLHNIKNLRGVWMGNFVYKNEPLMLGDLKGNNFQIALRDVTAPDHDIEQALMKLKEFGFVNYFGLQRFGNNPDSPTHEIGRQLVKEAFGQAVELILKSRGESEPPDLRSARDIWARTRDAGQALSALRNRRSIEAQLLHGLKQHGPNAYVNALDAIPRNVRLLYLHAYQSLLWNKVVSRRLESYRFEVLEGDLVLVKGETEIAVEEEVLAGLGEEDEITEQKPIDKSCPVKHVTADNIADYTIYDIVMPLPGSATVYPKNEVADWYRELLTEDGLTTESLGSRVKQYALLGGYRKMLKKPKNVSWKIMKYSKPEDDLILSDVDKMEGRTLPEVDGSLRAVVLTLDLDTCTYATMALREVLRADTSASHQTHLNGEAGKRQTDDPDIAEPPEKKSKWENGDEKMNGAAESIAAN